MAQLNFPISPNRFITVTYQSNDYLNRELDNKVKQNIAEILIEVADVKKIHSYVHGQIIIEIPSNNSVGTLKKVVEALSKPMASLAPPLLYSVDLAANSGNNQNWIYVNGDSEMNTNFLKSISEFWPKK